MARVTAVGLTGAGRVRSRNEDCLGLSEWVRQRPMVTPIQLSMEVREPSLFVVADGMGGHAHGDAASLMAVTRLMGKSQTLTDEDSVIAAIKDVNDAVFDLMKANVAFRGMGTTLAGITILSDKIIGFNIGDSRVYRFNHNYLQLLSADDTNSFLHTSTEERTGVNSHSLMQSIGGASERTDIFPHSWSRPLNSPERFLLCTDGLTDMLDQGDMEDANEVDANKTILSLHEKALFKGGYDNISVIIVDVLI